jgi:hypothetical protein
MIEAKGDAEIDLLRLAQAIRSTRIQKLARSGILGVVANILHKQTSPLGHLFFDHKGGLRDPGGNHVGRMKEFSQHATYAPAVVQFPRPGHLQIRLRAGTMLRAPVGSATPVTSDRSTFPGIGLTCHFIAGARSVIPELPGPRTVAKYVGRSINNSRQGAMPRRHRVFVPSMI